MRPFPPIVPSLVGETFTASSGNQNATYTILSIVKRTRDFPAEGYIIYVISATAFGWHAGEIVTITTRSYWFENAVRIG